MAEKTIEQLQEEVEVLNEKLAATEADLNEKIQGEQELLAMNEKLVLEIEKLMANGPQVSEAKAEDYRKLSFKKGDDEYSFRIPALYHNGSKITALEVSVDEKLQDELIKMKSGMICLKSK